MHLFTKIKYMYQTCALLFINTISLTHFDIIYYDKVTIAFRILRMIMYSIISNTLFYNVVGKKDAVTYLGKFSTAN